MSDTAPKTDAGADAPVAEVSPRETSNPTVTTQDSRRWWIKLFVQPVLILAAGALLLAGLGVAQKLGWPFSKNTAAGSGSGSHVASSGGDSTRYICPMMCTPPQAEPGRCPVCAMELVPATSGGGRTDSRSVQIDPVARRLANIHTATVTLMPLDRTIRAVGELCYDEGSLKTISAYVDGRLDRLYADYTGVVVEKGDHLAMVYSPRLYSAQVEFLLAKKSLDQGRSATLQRVVDSTNDIHQSARQRLIELGMTDDQITQLVQAGEATSRMHLCAPISGTVIEKFAVEGQYVKEGQAIYNLADLSTVWLMLELFSEDAVAIRYGQRVEAELHSMPGRMFSGRVAFIDPTVDPTKRTVGIRVVMPNDDGLLRVGDYAKATIRVPMAGAHDPGAGIYDPELAGMWISPRHPHVVSPEPGKCPVCGVDLEPASRFGFVNTPTDSADALVVPRSAVLMNGGHSVVYVETESGRFEIRHVKLGASSGDQIVVLDGLEAGEQVATSGNFLIDSQMQLAGNPSLIDPTKAQTIPEIEFEEGDLPPIGAPQMVTSDADAMPQMALPTVMEPAGDQSAESFALSIEDQQLVQRQERCPVTDLPLGSMGAPIRVMVEGRPVFICCEACRKRLLAEPAKYLAKLNQEAVR
jgi:Cu(I)/Ag(I) efflux system membrane fusion protein